MSALLRALVSMLVTIFVVAIYYVGIAPAAVAIFDALEGFIGPSNPVGAGVISTIREVVTIFAPLILVIGSILIVFVVALRRRGTSRRVR